VRTKEKRGGERERERERESESPHRRHHDVCVRAGAAECAVVLEHRLDGLHRHLGGRHRVDPLGHRLRKPHHSPRDSGVSAAEVGSGWIAPNSESWLEGGSDLRGANRTGQAENESLVRGKTPTLSRRTWAISTGGQSFRDWANGRVTILPPCRAYRVGHTHVHGVGGELHGSGVRVR
jgi:hypothetical protein